MVVCLSGSKIEAITERVENTRVSGKGGSLLVHVGTNNVEREGTTAIVRNYRKLFRTSRNCRGMAISMLVQKLYREEEVEFLDLW